MPEDKGQTFSAEGISRSFHSRKFLFVACVLVSCKVLAMVLTGSGAITASEQRAVDSHVSYFGRASILHREYCYFDDEGKPKNKGKCHVELPRLPNLAGLGSSASAMDEEEYARQYYGTPLGKAIADPDIEIIYLHTLPDIWITCNNRKAFGCTFTENWPEKVTIFVPTFDKTIGNRILHHEIEYHAKRSIEH